MKEEIKYLIESCRKGNRTAQLNLYKQYAQLLYIACLRITGNTGEAEEAMQDSFLKIFKRIDQYNDKQSFEAWIHRIAVNTAIDYVRRQAPIMEELSENSDYIDPAGNEPDETEIQYTVKQIKEATRQLPNGYRVILSLYLFEGYDMEEIASILDIKPPSVRSQYMRAKRKLIEIITAN